jgi:2-dehydro-3-deoxygalactonokinase
MMRGEEAEIVGLYRPEFDGAVYILPGSHSKHIFVDEKGRISHFKTMMTGEMISALADGTILKGTVRLDLEGFDSKALLDGYDAADELGLGDALFKVRIMKNLFGASDIECYSFFLGAVMHDEIKSLAKSKAKYAVIGGKGQLRESMACLIREKTSVEVIALDDKSTESATAIGAVRIFEF